MVRELRPTDKGRTMLSLPRRFALGTSFLALILSLAASATATAEAATSSCGDRDVSRPFAYWGDSGSYFLVPGGDFESSTGWTLSGGARFVEGNEPFYVHDAADHRSLLLSSGAWTRTPSMCVDSDETTLRFFVRNTGSVLGALVVEARVRTTVLGVTTQTSLPLGVVLGTTQAWQPSLPVVFALSLNQLVGGTTTVDFRFTALGGAWQIDDVYVDPFKDRAAS
jgi:hypothetical protein